MKSLLDSLKISLDRIVPINDPNYIIGEESLLRKFQFWVDSTLLGQQGFLGTVVIGQVGNGKTHFLRYVKKHYNESPDFNVHGIYIPDMFVGGPFVTALNSIYKFIFSGTGNYSLQNYYDSWKKYISQNKDNMETLSKNIIFRYLLNCNNRDEEQLVLSYFSNETLFPDQLKFLRSKFGAKKNFITNDVEFAASICDGLEFIQQITNKSILLLFDEVDKVYSAETNSSCLSRVGVKILTAYRQLFDQLNLRNIRGVICVGTTPEAWKVLSNQTAFERRFRDRKIILKVPKDKSDCVKFIKNRLEEVNYELESSDEETIFNLVSNLNEEKTKTWTDVISQLNYKSEVTKDAIVSEPADIIVQILEDDITAMSWAEIKAKNAVLQKMYPKSAPTPIFTKLENLGKIKILSTSPKTYESVMSEEDSNE
ncbi:MAG: hypothetical protein KAX49_13495 [Halanaerobiales bacterium]|nr:hypothetical protein [Halanaerobiales bacterium]